ncbi:MAG: hypothetical protein ACLUB9_15090, partial [Mediterraneibacter faecis]
NPPILLAISVTKMLDHNIPCLYGRNTGPGRKDQGRWCSPFEKKGTAGKKETDETEKENGKEWCV